MTNTRITDPEILELRYPMILNKFCLRTDESGGKGKYRGGEGVEREIIFRKSATLSVLTERRVLHPYGMNGGHPGKCGLNLVRRADGRIIYVGSKTAIDIQCGDMFCLKTPGGGGYGLPEECEDQCDDTDGAASTIKKFHERGSVFEYRQAQESV